MEFKDFSLSIKDTKVKEFAEGLAQGKILATQCSRCGTRYYPPRHDCPRCLASEMRWVELEGEGKLVSFTAICVPPERFAVDFGRQAPFAQFAYHPAPVGIVELEGGARVLGWIVGVEQKDLQVGLRLKPEPQILPDGKATIVLTRAEEG